MTKNSFSDTKVLLDHLSDEIYLSHIWAVLYKMEILHIVLYNVQHTTYIGLNWDSMNIRLLLDILKADITLQYKV